MHTILHRPNRIMKHEAFSLMVLVGLTTLSGCASNQPLSADDSRNVSEVKVASLAVANPLREEQTLVTSDMKAAVLVVGLTQMSVLVDSARGQSN